MRAFRYLEVSVGCWAYGKMTDRSLFVLTQFVFSVITGILHIFGPQPEKLIIVFHLELRASHSVTPVRRILINEFDYTSVALVIKRSVRYPGTNVTESAPRFFVGLYHNNEMIIG